MDSYKKPLVVKVDFLLRLRDGYPLKSFILQRESVILFEQMYPIQKS